MQDMLSVNDYIFLKEHALSYNACSSLENELNPETNFAAFSLKIANNTPIITNSIAKIIHDQNPIFIIISIPPPSAGGTNSNESVPTLYTVL